MYPSSPLRSTLNTGYITALDMCEVCTEAVHSVALWTRVTSQLWWSMYPSSPFRSTLNTGYITALDMCEVCTEAVHSVALWTRVTSQLWTCVKYVQKQSIPQHFEHGLHHSFGHVWSMYRSSPLRSTFNTITSQLWTCVKYVPMQSIPYTDFDTNVITGLGMCQVCTEAVNCKALRARMSSQVWTCVKFVPKQSIP